LCKEGENGKREKWEGTIDVDIEIEPVRQCFAPYFRPSAEQRPCFAWCPSVPGPRFISYAKVINRKKLPIPLFPLFLFPFPYAYFIPLKSFFFRKRDVRGGIWPAMIW
jgi:hypothetical protein